MAGDRAIVAERALEVVSKQLDSGAHHNTTLQITLDNCVAKEASLLQTLSVNTQNVEQFHVDKNSTINTLSHILTTKGITVPLQNLANRVIQHYINLNKSNEGVYILKQSIVRALEYKRVGHERCKATKPEEVDAKESVANVG